ncbi:MAG TPA: hypothetical protein ENJ99_02830 [Rhizobiales bacterium]|nr:hypothetical protein [Hyphomicrobiales bacterium]
MKPLFIYAVLAGFALAGPLQAAPDQTASPPPAETDAAGNQLKSVEQQLEQARQREKKVREELAILENEASVISGKLISLAARAQSREALILAGQARIAALNSKEEELKASLHKKRNIMAELLIGLQRLERNPPPPLAAHPGDALAAIRSATLFGSIVPALKTQSEALRRSLLELQNIRATVRHEQNELKKNHTQLASTRRDLKSLLARKRQIVSKTRKGLLKEQERTAMLAAKAKNLRQLLARLARQRAIEEKKRREDAARREAARQRRALKPRIAFTKLRGRLALPARGRQLRKFNDKNAVGRKSKGLFLATVAGAQVTAPSTGVVEYAGKFLSYGQLLIMNVGEGYHILLAGLGRIDVKSGEEVFAGEPVGVMGDRPARGTLITAALDHSTPVLYIEFRKNNGPVDSAPWWQDNPRKARK